MKIACTKCKRYYTLDQQNTDIINEKGTQLKCTLCGGVSMVALVPVASNSVARRLAVQQGIPLKEVRMEDIEE